MLYFLISSRFMLAQVRNMKAVAATRTTRVAIGTAIDTSDGGLYVGIAIGRLKNSFSYLRLFWFVPTRTHALYNPYLAEGFPGQFVLKSPPNQLGMLNWAW